MEAKDSGKDRGGDVCAAGYPGCALSPAAHLGYPVVILDRGVGLSYSLHTGSKELYMGYIRLPGPINQNARIFLRE